jgi:hypothetical protein
MEIITDLGYVGFIISLGCLFGILYQKKRISELTFAVGHILEKLEEKKIEK